MSGLLEFLSDPDNQRTLSWIGGGVCTVVGALWVAYLKLRPGPKPEPAPPSTSVIADRGSIAAGGDVRIASDRVPVAVWLLMAAGLALLALALLNAGDTTVMKNSGAVGGDMTDSEIDIDVTGQ